MEALDQPSRVTLVTPSRYVSRGLHFGLEEWRSADWCWERDGQMVPIKNADLWQRVDRAMNIHQVDYRRWRIDRAHPPIANGTEPEWAPASSHEAAGVTAPAS